MLLMVSNESELIVCVGTPSAADVDTKRVIRADRVTFKDIIFAPRLEFPEPEIVETLCQVPRNVDLSQDSSHTKR